VAPASLERNRRAAIENIDNDPVAAVVREIMADRAQWTVSTVSRVRRQQWWT